MQESDSEIRTRVESGEYFRETLAMYDVLAHDAMSERYFYVFVTLLSLVALVIALVGVSSLYPLREEVPFIVETNNILDDLPRIQTLLSKGGENANVALKRHLVTQYVIAREGYRVEEIERSKGQVQSQSTQEVFDAYVQATDARNPQSPVSLYQRFSVRDIDVVSTQFADSDGLLMDVVFDATVRGRGENVKSRWQARVRFEYNGIEIDDTTSKIQPYQFRITGYSVKKVGDEG